MRRRGRRWWCAQRLFVEDKELVAGVNVEGTKGVIKMRVTGKERERDTMEKDGDALLESSTVDLKEDFIYVQCGGESERTIGEREYVCVYARACVCECV